MIIAVDFDGTLRFDNGAPNIDLIYKLKKAQRNGDTIILWTCREGARLSEAVHFLRANGFVPNIVNDNHPQIIKRLKCNSRKIFADVYIDDKGVSIC